MTEMDALRAAIKTRIDDDLLICAKHGYPATRFKDMRARYGDVETLKQLVMVGKIQSGFDRLEKLDLLSCSVEQQILDFHTLFGQEHISAAHWRLWYSRMARKSEAGFK